MSSDSTRLSDEEIRSLKEQKPVRWSKEAWEAAWMARGQPKPIRTHPIVLAGLLKTAEDIQAVAGLSDTPSIEKTTPISAENGTEVHFCRVGDSGFHKIAQWAKSQYQLKSIQVLFDGKRRFAWIVVPREGMAVEDS
ncbi:MAG: hypothetical protein M1840_008515 [Geoglossum simile]|nr:MAG: hypothetical protein M1839_006052 [Geoglossum umbratile]KAI9764377.1 MAG: hypothetical protein M1840_008515 [Geoglossum simile]